MGLQREAVERVIPASQDDLNPTFNNHSEVIEITPQQREMGIASHHFFMNRLYRRPTMIFEWYRGEEQVIIHPFDDSRTVITASDVRGSGKISERLAIAITGFKRIEDLLPYYLGVALEKTPYIRGLSGFYSRVWGPEESLHGLILGFILKYKGHKTEEQLDNEYYDTISHTWETPYPGVLLMLNYAAQQEGVTNDNYAGLEEEAKGEGATVVADLLAQIKRDEAYHQGCFISWIDFFHQFDPEGTKRSALAAAREFLMPGAATLSRREKREMASLSGFNNTVIAKAVARTLRAVKSMTEDEITETIKPYQIASAKTSP